MDNYHGVLQNKSAKVRNRTVFAISCGGRGAAVTSLSSFAYFERSGRWVDIVTEKQQEYYILNMTSRALYLRFKMTKTRRQNNIQIKLTITTDKDQYVSPSLDLLAAVPHHSLGALHGRHSFVLVKHQHEWIVRMVW